MSPDEIEAIIERKIQKRLAPLEHQVEALQRLLHKFEGASTLLKVLAFVAAPAIAVIAWAKDHIRF